MKRKLFTIAGALAVLLAFGLVLAGCGGDDPDPGSDWDPGTIDIYIYGIEDTSAVTTAELGDTLRVRLEKEPGGCSFQWNKDGTAIPGADSREYTPDTTGSYNVTVSTNAPGYLSKTSDAVTVTSLATDSVSIDVNVDLISHTVLSYISTIYIYLQLSKGSWQFGSSNEITNPSDRQNFADAVTVSGIDLDAFNIRRLDTTNSRRACLVYQNRSSSYFGSKSVTVTLNEDKLADLLQYTTVTGSLTVGTPATATDKDWVF
jgi:hypothetical protein